MEVRSLGYRTDLALLRLGGSELEDRDDCMVVRTPHNPTFWWGNFLLLPDVPAADETDRWLERFAEALPDAGHVALGFDGATRAASDLAAFTERGLRCEAATVMTAASVHEPPRPNRDPWTVRVASWSGRHRWPVLGLWLVFTIGLFAASLAAGGTNTQGAVSQNQRAKFESAHAYDVFNASGTTDPSQSVYVLLSSPNGTVDDPAFSSAVTKAVATLTALHSTVDGVDGPTFSQVLDPLTTPAAAGLVSPDRTTVRIVATAKGDGDILTQRMAPVGDTVAAIAAANPTLQVHGLSNTLANEQISDVVNKDLDGSLRLTIPLTFAILLIAFGTVVAAVIPLVMAISALLGAFGVLGLYSQLISPVSPYASQLVVLIGLAVAVDYSLFILSRFRAEQRRGRPRQVAIRQASATAGRAVFFSGLAVTISIAGLFLLDDPLFKSMAIGTISVVIISVIGSLTFLPAILSILGPGVDRLRIPYFGRHRAEGTGMWGRIVSAAMRRPVITFVASAGFLLLLAVPFLHFQLGVTDLTAFPDSVDSVKAIKLMNAKWPLFGPNSGAASVSASRKPAPSAASARNSTTKSPNSPRPKRAPTRER